MTAKEFDRELSRLSKLMASAATAGNDARVKEIEQQVQALFRDYLDIPAELKEMAE